MTVLFMFIMTYRINKDINMLEIENIIMNRASDFTMSNENRLINNNSDHFFEAKCILKQRLLNQSCRFYILIFTIQVNNLMRR